MNLKAIKPGTLVAKKLPIYFVVLVDVGGIDRQVLVSKIKEAGGLNEPAEKIITHESFDVPAETRVISVAAFEVCWFGENRFLDDKFLAAWSGQHLCEGIVCRTLAFDEPPFMAINGLEALPFPFLWCGVTPRRTVIDFQQTATMFRLARYDSSKPRLLEAHPRKHYPSHAERILLAVDRIAA